MLSSMDDKEFLEYVVKSLVNNPDAVQVDRRVDEMGVLLTLKVSQEDMGQIIGKNGTTARAIRTLLRIVGLKNNSRVNLKIEEPEGSTRGMRPEQSEQAAPEAAAEESATAEEPTEAEAPQEEEEERKKEPNIDDAIGNL